MVSPEILTDGSLNHNRPDNATTESVETNSQVDNPNTSSRIAEGVKQPSYLSLACCISGYTTLTTYNSKQREGFRSRDISPARITGVSPHAADDGSSGHPSIFTSACGNFLTPQPRYLTEMDHRKKSGDNMWNGNGTAHKVSSSTFTSSTTLSGNSSFYRCETRREASSTYHSTTGDSVTSQTREVPAQTSSFIVQRVERLYGPGALAQGFYTRRSLNSSPITQKEKPEEVLKESGKESALPVLRLLRPEFRAQLTLANRKSTSPISSPNRPLDTIDGAVERIIPVAVEVNNETNSKIIEERETVNVSAVKDGHFYLKMVLEETVRLEILAAEMEVEVSSVPEYMEGRLRAAAGKARLLASQKLAQFKGLCFKNINQDTSEDFPTTCEDLAGFWDMVSIQVASVHEEFNQIDVLRKKGWPEQDAVEGEGMKKEQVSNGSGASRRAKSGAAPVKSDLSKARDEARKRMLAERRKEMRKNTTTTEDIVIV